MKHWMIRKAGTVFLSTAAGFCLLPAEAVLGQDPAASLEIQRRLAEMYARDGKQMPEMNLEKLPATLPNGQPVIMPRQLPPQQSAAPFGPEATPAAGKVQAQSNPAQGLAVPQSAPRVQRLPAGIKAPVTAAKLSGEPFTKERPQIVPRHAAPTEETVVAFPIATAEDFQFEMPVVVKEDAQEKSPADEESPAEESPADPFAEAKGFEETPPFPDAEIPSAPPQIGLTQPDTLNEAAPPVSESGPLALDGFCPVTLRNDRTMVKGIAEYTCEWQGATYRLTSAQAKAKFEAQPERFAPVKAGCDVIRAEKTGEHVPGSLEHAVWFHRQLYLFESNANRQAFSENPDRFAQR